MSGKIKKWQLKEIHAKIKIEKEKERTKYIINSKIKEINKLKAEIACYKELNKLQETTIKVLVGKGSIGKYISKSDMSDALKEEKQITIKEVENGYRLKVE